MHETIEGKIQNVAFGGAGILKEEGRVVFVPFTTIGDEVRVQIVQRKKSYIRAKLIELKKAGPSRKEPRCSHYGICQGCHLQHVSDEQQLIYKRQWVKDALERIARLKNVDAKEVVSAKEKWAYRRQIRLHVQKKGDSYVAGYMDADGKTLIPIHECPIFTENLVLEKQTSAGEITLFKSGEKFFGVDGLLFKYGPRSYIQTHPDVSEKLYQDLVRRVLACKPKNLVDLYSGIGVTSLLIAREGVHVTGIEISAEAVALAKSNAAQNKISNVEFLNEDVDDALCHKITGIDEMVLLNPPRTGLSQTVKEALLKHGPKDLFYVSCMPSTLARDVGDFAKQGYELIHCQPYDMFPQTTHVETMVHLTLS